MHAAEEKLINALFNKIQQTSTQAQPRDPQAEALIDRQIKNIPGATYYMAQTLIVQQQALKQVEARIAELEQQASQSTGFFGGLFGTSPPTPPSKPSYQSHPAQYQENSGGDFLAGAAQTALGIGGGILLANAAMSLGEAIFGGDSGVVDNLFGAEQINAGLVDSGEVQYESFLPEATSDFMSGDFLGGDDSGGDDFDFDL